MDYKEYFLTDNASGWKTTENKLSKNNLDLYNKIIKFNNSSPELIELPFKQKVWHFMNDIQYKPKCLECSKELKFGRSLKEGYPIYCSISCGNKSDIHKKNVKITNNIKYGGDVPICSEEVLNKSRTTCIDKYGVDNPMKLDRVKEVFKTGSLLKYGTEYPAQSKVVNIRIENKDRYKHVNIVENNDGIYKTKCPDCNEISEFNNNEINYRLRQDMPVCKHCFEIKTNISFPETEVSTFIKSLGLTVIESDRIILKPKHLDVYIPTHNIAIEFNGLYWHDETRKTKNYHLDKTDRCEEQGIQLIHIFEDEWLYKQDIVKSRIKNLVGFTNTKIYGRKTIIKVVTKKDSKLFLETNHIQGNIGSKIKLGLYYNDELVSLMTFGGLRKAMGSISEDGSYELLRFCNKLDTSVIGGADKLLKHFIKTYVPKRILSYADRRWSKGDLYEKLGFSFIHNSIPSYSYIINGTRKHKFSYRKDVLVKEGFDKNKSAEQIMFDRGIYRIYDCGTKTYELLC